MKKALARGWCLKEHRQNRTVTIPSWDKAIYARFEIVNRLTGGLGKSIEFFLSAYPEANDNPKEKTDPLISLPAPSASP